MSRRQRSARESAQRLKVAREKASRRRTRARRAAGAAAAAVTLAGGGAAAVSPAEATAGDASTGHLAGASLAGCTSATTPDSDPSYLTDVGGDLYFTAFDGEHGQALWKTDGTASSTVLLKEFGSDGGYDDYEYYGSRPSDLTDVDGTLFFRVDGGDKDELWRSDGTPGGTVKVRRFQSIGSGYDDEGGFAAVGDTVYFAADDGTHGEELWRSDGTRSGTVLVKDIGSGSSGGDDYDYYSDGPANLTPAGANGLFFTANDGIHGEELWRSDGTKAGTVLVRNIRPGSYSSDARSFTAVGDDVFFTARDGVHGRELWTSDGTKEGTVLVKDIRPGGGTAVNGPVVATDDGTVFFGADGDGGGRDLWRSDGTAAGTVLVKDFAIGGYKGYYSLRELVAVGDTLFFAGADETHGMELWASDGTEAGTAMVKDIRPGDYDGYPTGLTAVGGDVYFVARDGVHGPEVWRSDGTKAGTALVKDVDPGAGSRPRSLTESGGQLYFTADDAVHGQELWHSDGTAAGTELVKDINLGGAFAVASRGIPNTDKGTVRVRVFTDGAGTLSVARNRWIRGSSRDVEPSGDDGARFNVTLEPTRAAKRVLRREGELKVTAKFTFNSCGGAVSSVTHHYTLRMG